MRRTIPFLFAACLVSCHSGNSDQKLVEGNWDLVVLKGMVNPKGHLSLHENNTFEAEVPEKFKMPPTGKSSVMKGSYTLTREHLDDRSILFIDFAVAQVDGKSASSESGFRLGYDVKNRVLFDLLTMAFCRPEDRVKVSAIYAKQRAARL